MDVICVTNKKIAEENSLDFYALIERIARERPKKIILREKQQGIKSNVKITVAEITCPGGPVFMQRDRALLAAL